VPELETQMEKTIQVESPTLEQENGFEPAEENSNDPELLFWEKQLEDNLMKAIQTLPEKTRIVFVLNAIEGLSYDEIAETLHIKRGTASSRLHLAKKALSIPWN